MHFHGCKVAVERLHLIITVQQQQQQKTPASGTPSVGTGPSLRKTRYITSSVHYVIKRLTLARTISLGLTT